VFDQKKLAGKVKLVASTPSDKEVEALKSGTIQALIVQDPYQMGYKAVKTALKAIKKETVEKKVDSGLKVVTKENLETPENSEAAAPSVNYPTSESRGHSGLIGLGFWICGFGFWPRLVQYCNNQCLWPVRRSLEIAGGDAPLVGRRPPVLCVSMWRFEQRTFPSEPLNRLSISACCGLLGAFRAAGAGGVQRARGRSFQDGAALKPARALRRTSHVFESKIRALLAAKCFSCHGDQDQRGGLRLDNREAALKGGAERRGPYHRQPGDQPAW